MSSCHACGQYLPVNTCIKCCKCKKKFHKNCVALTSAVATAQHWTCPWCVVNMSRNEEDLFEARDANGSIFINDNMDDNSSDINVAGAIYVQRENMVGRRLESGLKRELLSEVRVFRGEMSEMKKEMGQFRQETVDMRDDSHEKASRIADMAVQLDAFETRLAEVEANTAHILEMENTIRKLRQDLNDREQELMANDIEINGLPENEDEHLPGILLMIAERIEAGISMDEIKMLRRNGTLRPNGSRNRSRSVIVRFVRQNVKERILQAFRARRYFILPDDDDETRQPSRIFINERLTRENKRLFNKAREEAKRLKWRFVWTIQGKIFMRQGEGHPAHRIRSDADIYNAFCSYYNANFVEENSEDN